MTAALDIIDRLRRRVRILQGATWALFAAAPAVLFAAALSGGRFTQSGAVLAALLSAAGFLFWTKTREARHLLELAQMSLLVPTAGD